MRLCCNKGTHASYRVLLILYLLCTPPGHADEQVIQVACENWPGYCSQEGGVYLDILNAIYAPQGFTLSVSLLPFKRALYQLEHASIDLIPGIYKTPERQKTFIYPRFRLSNSIAVDAYLAGRSQWNTPRRYARVRGYHYGVVQGELIEVEKNQHALHLLHIGRADYFSTDLLELAITLKDMGIPFTDYAYIITSREGLYVAFSNTQRGKQLSMIYDEGIHTLYQSGYLQEMLGAQVRTLFDERTRGEYVRFPEFE